MADTEGLAVRKAFEVLSRNGSAEQRLLAADVLDGRHTVRDLLGNGIGQPATLRTLVERWDRASAAERAAARDTADEAVAVLYGEIAGLRLPERRRAAPVEPEDDDGVVPVIFDRG